MSYSQAPPTYSAPKKGYSAVPQSDVPAAASAATPLLASSHDAAAPQPRQEGDVDADDFKYGVSVEQSTPEVRQMFLKKVYSILFLQLLGTALVGSTMRIPAVSAWVMNNSWIVIATSISALISMGVLYFKRHSHPTNLLLLGLFTTLEAVSLGSAIAYVNQVVVLQALILTLFVFAGLTLFVWIFPELNYAKLAPWLFGALLLLVGAGFVQLFVPFSNAVDMAFAGIGVVVFSGYILFDTHMIMKRMSAEEWVLAVISLYLDIINLFLSILRILNGVQDD